MMVFTASTGMRKMRKAPAEAEAAAVLAQMGSPAVDSCASSSDSTPAPGQSGGARGILTGRTGSVAQHLAELLASLQNTRLGLPPRSRAPSTVRGWARRNSVGPTCVGRGVAKARQRALQQRGEQAPASTQWIRWRPLLLASPESKGSAPLTAAGHCACPLEREGPQSLPGPGRAPCPIINSPAPAAAGLRLPPVEARDAAVFVQRLERLGGGGAIPAPASHH